MPRERKSGTVPVRVMAFEHRSLPLRMLFDAYLSLFPGTRHADVGKTDGRCSTRVAAWPSAFLCMYTLSVMT